MKFLGSLHIDIKLLIAQLINFGLLLLLLTKFLYKPVIKQIEYDEKELNKVKKIKIALEKEKQELSREKKKEMNETKNKAKKIIKEAENMAAKIKVRAQKEATQERQEVIKQIKAKLIDIKNEERKSKQKNR